MHGVGSLAFSSATLNEMDHKLATSYHNAPSDDDDARVHRNPIESLIITLILVQYLKARAHDILRTLLKLSVSDGHGRTCSVEAPELH